MALLWIRSDNRFFCFHKPGCLSVSILNLKNKLARKLLFDTYMMHK